MHSLSMLKLIITLTFLSRIKSSAPSHNKTIGNDGSHLWNTSPIQGGSEIKSHGLRRCHQGWAQTKGLGSIAAWSSVSVGKRKKGIKSQRRSDGHNNEDLRFCNTKCWVPVPAKGPHTSHPNSHPCTAASSAVPMQQLLSPSLSCFLFFPF